jgi:hypothetical protein
MYLNHEYRLMDDNRCFRRNRSDCEVTAGKRNSKLQRVKISEGTQLWKYPQRNQTSNRDWKQGVIR